tara:strand:- start:398 stop:673 length:276 start_codon:yes stop_codon:yes gene_type:complete
MPTSTEVINYTLDNVQNQPVDLKGAVESHWNVSADVRLYTHLSRTGPFFVIPATTGAMNPFRMLSKDGYLYISSDGGAGATVQILIVKEGY